MATKEEWQRGKVYNSRRAGQLRDYSGLRWGKITPTDIDALIDYHGHLFIRLEFKYGNASLPYGQRLALENVSKAEDRNNVRSFALVCVHNHPPDEVIDGASAIVIEAYDPRKGWITLTKPSTAKECCDWLIKKWGIHAQTLH